ncbi:SDR family NAD(P)-dependent oxidoreductase [Ruminococcus sp.]|uniref:SDR family NAD(P)-dependent oxidoreductase n=1 Tax=Ruminococcus sp. TaxID=41978 RepID=UPI003F0EF56E
MRAVITGATSGIGREMAIYLSQLGYDLILTGRNETMLCKLQQALPTRVETIPLDLSEPRAPFQLYAFCKDKQVDLLVNNAGYGLFGPFDQIDLENELNMLNVNIRALHILTKLFLRDFKQRNRGRILNVASSAGFLTGPLLSSYYASKNYVVRLTLAIHEELRRANSKVTVSLLCPGPVDTNFNNRAGVQFSMPPASPERVARYGIDGALKGKLILIPELRVRLGVFGSRFVPHKLLSAITYEIQKKKLQ